MFNGCIRQFAASRYIASLQANELARTEIVSVRHADFDQLEQERTARFGTSAFLTFICWHIVLVCALVVGSFSTSLSLSFSSQHRTPLLFKANWMSKYSVLLIGVKRVLFTWLVKLSASQTCRSSIDFSCLFSVWCGLQYRFHLIFADRCR
jgi:hypothetical protein